MRIAMPNKGRLQQPTLMLLQLAGIKPTAIDERALILPTNWEGVELIMVRPEDIPYIVESGGADIGITGHDYVIESGADVDEVMPLDFGNAQVVLAVPRSWGVGSVDELKAMGREIRIATKYYNIAFKYITQRGLKARIVRISGAAEVMPYLGAADAVVDVMSTGTTLRVHGLEPVDVIMRTHAVLIASRGWVGSSVADKIELVITMIRGVMAAKGKKMLFMNVPNNALQDVLTMLPAMLAPAVTKLSTSNAWEVITVVDEDLLPVIIARAKAAGARDIVVIGIEKVIR